MNSAVLITGALGGIGRALCEEFHSHGYKVIALDKQAGKVPAHLLLQIDIRTIATNEEVRSDLFGKVDSFLQKEGADLKGLINNAAIQILGETNQLTSKDWQETLETNLLAPFFLSQLFLPQLEKAKGSIVNVSSIHEKLTKPTFVAYATSKSALSGLTRSMAVDLGGKVRVNAICPAAIGTTMLAAGFAGKPDALVSLQSAHPSGRIGMPEEVAQLARFLIAEAPPFLTGSCLGLDGGIAGRLHDPA